MSTTPEQSPAEVRAGTNAQPAEPRFKSYVLSIEAVQTPVGVLMLVATEKGVSACNFDDKPVGTPYEGDPRALLRPGNIDDRPREHMAVAITQMREYLAGTRREFTLPLDDEMQSPSPFTRACWAHLMTIPYATTQSYGEVARALGDPKATRAVGGANGRNPICIIRPCHRVIGADGSLTGFAGGVERKRWLLEHERTHAKITTPSLFTPASETT